MRLWYGSYAFEDNATLVSKRVETAQNEAAQPLTQTVTIEVEGTFSGDSQAELSAKEVQLTVALQIPYRDLVFRRDDGGPSGVYLLNAGSLSGVRIVAGPDFVTTRGPEYATLRTFRFVAQAEYPAPGARGNFLVRFRETVALGGGGPLVAFLPAIVGPPQKQILNAQTPYEASQQGAAVGYLSYPIPPAPIWPAHLVRAPRYTRSSPERRGALYVNWEITWDYQFQSVVPLLGVPNVWR